MKARREKPKKTPALSVRLPLPKKSEKRHSDTKKYDRKREKERFRKELRRGDAETR